ncbi:MAG: pyridoxine 5-phosphate synthase [Verrucomicrobiales bacterium]|jgi:pyridoxine 5-phosphate synthase
MPLKLGVNIDHVATLRQARYATLLDSANAEPVLLDLAKEAVAGGADSLTIHLRADRRHLQDDDVTTICEANLVPVNLEMGNTEEILLIALAHTPAFVCLVPENRQEISTEGGLDAVGQRTALQDTIKRLQGAGIAVSLFIDPDAEQLEASKELGAEMVELHTGCYANAIDTGGMDHELQRLVEAAKVGHQLGLQVNAGHGINTSNIARLYQVPHLAELNIGHHLVSRALLIGLRQSVAEMRALMNAYPA